METTTQQPGAENAKSAQSGEEGQMAQDSNWNLVVSCLHHSGENNSALTPEQHQTVRRAADGFGMVTGMDSESLDMLFDWSHVRDSSQKAIDRMAMLLKVWGFTAS